MLPAPVSMGLNKVDLIPHVFEEVVTLSSQFKMITQLKFDNKSWKFHWFANKNFGWEIWHPHAPPVGTGLNKVQEMKVQMYFYSFM